MSVEPKARFSSILLKAKKKENKPTCCNFSHGSASEYGSFLRCVQVMFSWPAQGLFGCPPMFLAAFSPYDSSKIAVIFPLPLTQPL